MVRFISMHLPRNTSTSASTIKQLPSLDTILIQPPRRIRPRITRQQILTPPIRRVNIPPNRPTSNTCTLLQHTPHLKLRLIVKRPPTRRALHSSIKPHLRRPIQPLFRRDAENRVRLIGPLAAVDVFCGRWVGGEAGYAEHRGLPGHVGGGGAGGGVGGGGVVVGEIFDGSCALDPFAAVDGAGEGGLGGCCWGEEGC
jgi:hypothetical protein